MTKANQLPVSPVIHLKVIYTLAVLVGIGLSIAVPSGALAETKKIVAKEGAIYLVPAGSPVKFKSNDEWTVASFQGQFTVSGSYRVQYDGVPARKNCEVCVPIWNVNFKPDRAQARKLPHWTRGPVRELYFQNADEFVGSILSEKTTNQLRSGEMLVASGRTTLIVENFTASVDCDTASYSVRFVRMLGQADMFLAKSKGQPDSGC
jgi:hypothetical protein